MKKFLLSVNFAMLILLGVFATTSHQEEVKCPACGSTVKLEVLSSTNNLGGMDWDFCSRAGGAQPILLIPGTCPNCYYSGYYGDFGKDVEIPKEVKQKITKDKMLKPLLEMKDDRIPAYVKYDLIAQTCILTGKDDLRIGDQYLRGSWAVRLIWWSNMLPDDVQKEVDDILEEHRKSKGDYERGNDAAIRTEWGYELSAKVPGLSGNKKAYTALAAIYLLKTFGENPEVIKLLPAVKSGLKAEDYTKYEKDIMDSINQERYFQKKAVEFYEKGLPTLTKDDEISSMNYSIAELYRRLGENEKAKKYYGESLKKGEMPEHFKIYIEGQLKTL